MRRAWIPLLGMILVTLFTKISQAQLPIVQPVDWSKLKPADFADDELDMPYFLAHLSTVANAVVDRGENRGFIDIAVWRSRDNNRPYNARILENCLSLAYFYCTRRPWNPYFGDPALRKRLEAVLEYWCGMQSEDGRFSEYGPKEWNLAATAFATKFMGATLVLLQNGPPIDSVLMKRVVQADRKAIDAVLRREDLYAHGRIYTNQYCNVWPGALSYLRLVPDPEIEAWLRKRIRETVADFQSPVGYFYERNGPDWSYNLGTQPTNLEAAKRYAADPEIRNTFIGQEKLFYDWLSYNAVPEPDDPVFFLNRAVETRGRVPFIGREPAGLFSRDAPPGEDVELARLFCTSREELDGRRREVRTRLEKAWPAVDELRGFTPYDFLGRDFPRWLPTDAERRRAIAKLPTLAKERFIHQRTDSRFPVSYSFIRRPSYYAAFNSGQILNGMQRYGLGLLWNPAAGAVLQSQTGSRDGAWGTLLKDSAAVVEAGTFHPVFSVDGRTVRPKAGASDLPDGVLAVEYAVRKTGSKKIRFEENGIRIAVQYKGNFTENIPLLVGGKNSLVLKPGRVELGRFTIRFDPKAKPRIQEMEERQSFGSHGSEFKYVRIVKIEARDSLEYELKFSE